MKTLARHGINEKLLLQTYAYVVTHSKLWNQGNWRHLEIENNRCKTAMCFAGHTAITLRGAKDVIPMPKASVFSALRAGKGTEEQHALVDAWYETEEYVLATPAEIRDGLAMERSYLDKTYHVVDIQDRASRLLGYSAVKDFGDLFDGDNSLERIREIISKALGIDESEVDERAKKVARENRWRGFNPQALIDASDG
jgi:hypothetical protein